MGRPLSAGEVTTYRSPRQATRVLFAIPEYHTIYTAQLNAVPTSNDVVGQITFTGGVGTLADVLADMTLYVGTSAGAYDLGMCRIRKPPIAGTFYVGEMSEVDWAAGGTIYLTVVDDYSLWARPVRLVSGVAKMDYDVAYSDQHANFDPVPVLGSHAVAKLVNGTVNVRLGPSADSDSWVEASTISSYAWTCSGADSISGPTTKNPTATFTTAGTYLAYCTVTAANGKIYKGIRYVIIHDNDNPLHTGVLRNVTYSHESGGMSFNVLMYADAGEAVIRKRSLVIVVTEDTISNVATSLPCPIQGRENILAVGWIGSESITFHETMGAVEFTVHNAANWFKAMEGYLSGVEFIAGVATDWTNMPELTVRRMLWHFLHWRTTATRLMDVLPTDDTRYAVGFKTITGALWEQLVIISDTSIFAKPGVDRFNRLWIEIDPQMVPEADRTGFPEIMDLDNQDWVGEVKVREELPRISMLYFSGISVDASANPLAFVSLSPGHVHGRYGRTMPLDNFLVTDQDGSNELAGLYYGWQNNLKEFELEMAASQRMTDIYPRQYVNLTITADEDPRGQGYDGRAILRRMEMSHDARNGALSFSHFYEPETFEGLAIDGDIPDSEDGWGGIPRIPPLKPIPLTPITLPVIPGDVPTDIPPKVVAIATTNKGILFTVNGDEASPSWSFMNAGLPSANYYNGVERLIKTPSGAMFAMIRDYSLIVTNIGAQAVYYAGGVGDSWTLVMDTTGLPGTNPRLIALGSNPDVSEEIAIATGSDTDLVGRIYTGDRSGVTQLVSGIDSHRRLGDISYGLGKWYLTHAEQNIFGSQAWTRVTAAGALEINSDNYGSGQTYSASRQSHIRRGGTVYAWNYDSRYLRTITDNDGAASNTTMPNVGALGYTSPKLIDGDPTGQYFMGGQSGVIGQRSTDGGATWGNVDASLGIGYDVWGNAGNSSRYMTATTQVVKWTNDFGDTWFDMSGNLATIAPLCAIEHILFVGD